MLPTTDSPDLPTVQVRRRGDGVPSVREQLLTAGPEPTPAPPTPVIEIAPPPVVQPPPAMETAPPQPQPVEPPCPRCGTKLIDPESLALCPQCGWCRSLHETTSMSPRGTQTVRRRSVLGSAEFWDLLWKLPTWVILLAGGILFAGVFSSGVSRLLPQGFLRAAWTTGQIGFGLILIVAAQAWSLVLFAPRDDRLGARDLFLAGRLWNLTLKHLPETQWQLAVAVLGLALAVAAVFCIGGLTYWLPVPK